MVNPGQELNQSETGSPTEANHTTVQLSEVFANGSRFEASNYEAQARKYVERVSAYRLGSRVLYGDDGFSQFASNAFRFKRIFVKREFGVPFLSSSSILDIDHRPKGFLSTEHSKKLDELRVSAYDLLVSCSGTIGNVGMIGKRQDGWTCTQDAIKIRFDSPDTAGFAAAFLRTEYGRAQLTRTQYGSVIRHIEPEHLKSVLLPNVHDIERISIGRKMIEAVDARDAALDALDAARALVTKASGLRLPDQTSGLNTVKAKDLHNRFEAGYHSNAASSLEAEMINNPDRFVRIGASITQAEVSAVTKFRKRVYVASPGIPLYSSKSMFQIDPIGMKYLGAGVHQKDLPEIAIKPGMVMLTCSGTIGRIFTVPEYMNGWAVNQHAIRIFSDVAAHNSLLYAWLSSPIGNTLVTRNAYGSVILEIDRWMVEDILIPHPETVPVAKIHRLVSSANDLRTRAWELEEQAKAMIVELLD